MAEEVRQKKVEIKGFENARKKSPKEKENEKKKNNKRRMRR